MAKIVVISTSGAVNAKYNATMEYLDAKYHRHPTSFQDFKSGKDLVGYTRNVDAPISDDGRQILVNGEWIPIGKAVL